MNITVYQVYKAAGEALHGAFVRGYGTILLSDARTTEDLSAWGAPPRDKVIAHTNLYRNDTHDPGRSAATAPTRDVGFAQSPTRSP